MTTRKSLVMISGAVLLLAGGSDFSQRWDAFTAPSTPARPATQPVATEPDIVSVKLAQAADKASRALDSIANIEQQKNPAVSPLPNDYSTAAPNMMQPVTL